MLLSYRDSPKPDSGSTESLLASSEEASEYVRKTPGSFRLAVLIPWLLCLVLFALLGLSSVFRPQGYGYGDFWGPYEFKPATRELPWAYHDVQFDAALHYNSSHLLYRPITDPPFVGDPSPEIDAAWKGLMGSVDIFVTPDEQKEYGQSLWLDPDTGLYVGLLSVMHDLHCINMLRMNLNPEYYPKMKHYTNKIHIEHCIDALRLSIMCKGDMTLIPTKDSDSRPFEAVFESVHACRDFSAIRDWSLDRDSATPEKYHENADALKKKKGIM